ncbi:MAG: nuclear transport factor 2 family protein [Ignavibacteriae bacterium]|nr:nuclear transport factor 2 family protein [Ignavibacteriota bacterium]
MIHFAPRILLIAVFFFGCSTDPRIQTLSDQSDVIKTINTLFIETDNRNWDGVKAVFADTVLFDMTSIAGGEPARMSSQNIVDAWDQGLKSLKALHHQAGNYVVTINGSEADAFCYGIAIHYLPNAQNQNTRTFVGSYNFHLSKRAQSWRIDKFKFKLKFIDGNKELTGQAK